MDESTPAAGALVGHYTLVEPIARGGMGEVWKATDSRSETPGRPVAVKVIAADRLESDEAVDRFQREIEAARRVDTPEVAAVLDADPIGPRPWLASEFIEGATLAHRVTSDGPLHEQALRTLALGLLRGLDAIHRAGVVHRDLTPGNVVLGPDGPVIVDFGVSRVDGTTTITQSGALVGTPAWMAPEQFRDGEVSDASDVWAWGAVMAFAATGRPPVEADRTETAIAKVLDGALDLDGVPDWLQPSVVACLDPVSARRPTADELLARLDRSGRGLAAGALTRADPVTQVAPRSSRPTRVDDAAVVPSAESEPPPGRDWRRLAIRAGVLGGSVVVGILLPTLLALVAFTVGVLGAAAVRIWTEERHGGVVPTLNGATILVGSLLLLAAGLSSAIGVALAVVAVVALVALFLAVGGDIG